MLQLELHFVRYHVKTIAAIKVLVELKYRIWKGNYFGQFCCRSGENTGLNAVCSVHLKRLSVQNNNCDGVWFQTVKCNTIGTINMLGLASRVKAKFLFASTSEIYGGKYELCTNLPSPQSR